MIARAVAFARERAFAFNRVSGAIDNGGLDRRRCFPHKA
jgi:hypothetical protein